jgi:cytochrome c oxidase subunit IV
VSDTETETTDRGHFGLGTDEPTEVAAPEVATPEPTEGGADDGRGMGNLDDGHQHGPTDGQYFMLFWVLLALTALEVSTYWWDDWFGDTDAVRYAATTVLFILMSIKFVAIAGVFMHLKFDAAILRRTFVFGLILGVAVYCIALTAMNFWTYSGTPFFDDPPPEITTTTLAEGG